MNKEIT